jgi:hypothetical protein
VPAIPAADLGVRNVQCSSNMSSLPLLPRPLPPVGFKTGLAVGFVIVSAIRGCAFDVAQMTRSLDDGRHARTVTTTTTSAIDELPAPPVIPTADVEALPRAAVRVEDLPRSRTR